jgi:aspartate/methionine/tyrosine aminotransferase
MFSSRLPRELAANRLSQLVERARRSDVPLLDLTETNPTRVGLPYPSDLLSALASPAGGGYEPDPRGLASARAVVAAEQRNRGRSVDPEHIVLTASTSEAYSVLFKLLCDPGDEVLTPQPSYPLFELLSRLDGVVARPYALEAHACWAVDRDSVRAALTSRTRALLVVSPNNPTGSILSAADREWLCELAAERDLAVIVDEVFADFPLGAPQTAPRLARGALSLSKGAAPHVRSGAPDVLLFTLGGLSKSIGLPQVKLAWIVVDGPGDRVSAALERIDVICDTYLSVSTPVQLALPALLDRGRSVRDAIRQRIGANLSSLGGAVQRHPSVTLLAPRAGWSAVLQVPATEPEEMMVSRLIERHHVLVHPGYFFDFPTEAFIVISLLPAPEVFDEAVSRMLGAVAGAG